MESVGKLASSFGALSTREQAAAQARLAGANPTDNPDSMLVVANEEAAAPYIAFNLEHAANTLEQIYYSHTGRFTLKWHHYLAIYDRHLQGYKALAAEPVHDPVSPLCPNGQLRILEIGVNHGGSLQIWRRYFGPQATIFGIDIDPRCKSVEDGGCEVRIGDQSDASFLAGVVAEMGGVDIVIDDGSHIASHQLASFKALFPLLAPGGIYICEDLHTSYWEGWGGGYKRPGTFVEVAKDIVDHIHEWYAPAQTDLSPLGLKKSVLGVSFYDSVVVIEKGQKLRPYAISIGKPSFETSA